MQLKLANGKTLVNIATVEFQGPHDNDYCRVLESNGLFIAQTLTFGEHPKCECIWITLDEAKETFDEAYEIVQKYFANLVA